MLYNRSSKDNGKKTSVTCLEWKEQNCMHVAVLGIGATSKNSELNYFIHDGECEYSHSRLIHIKSLLPSDVKNNGSKGG